MLVDDYVSKYPNEANQPAATIAESEAQKNIKDKDQCKTAIDEAADEVKEANDTITKRVDEKRTVEDQLAQNEVDTAEAQVAEAEKANSDIEKALNEAGDPSVIRNLLNNLNQGQVNENSWIKSLETDTEVSQLMELAESEGWPIFKTLDSLTSQTVKIILDKVNIQWGTRPTSFQNDPSKVNSWDNQPMVNVSGWFVV
jgi:chromosome segregation ATPase